jgi:hypothetical protein
MPSALHVEPVATVVGGRAKPFDDDWDAVESVIRLRVGIFAQRAKDRPNRIGVGVARLLGVEGRELRQPAWSRELMAGYWRSS